MCRMIPRSKDCQEIGPPPQACASRPCHDTPPFGTSCPRSGLLRGVHLEPCPGSGPGLELCGVGIAGSRGRGCVLVSHRGLRDTVGGPGIHGGSLDVCPLLRRMEQGGLVPTRHPDLPPGEGGFRLGRDGKAGEAVSVCGAELDVCGPQDPCPRFCFGSINDCDQGALACRGIRLRAQGSVPG